MSPQPRGWSEDANANRTEDLALFASTGQTTEGAARRLGISVLSLERWCDRHDQRDLWRQLADNETRGHIRVGRIGVTLR